MLIVIRAHIKRGIVSDYVLRTILAIREAGWYQPDELIWLKPDAPPLGSKQRPRRTWEHILWFAKHKHPYATCSETDSNVILAYTGGMDRGIMHPALYPPALVWQLLLRYARPGSLVIDPWAGSGTTCLVAQSLNYQTVGIDLKPEYVELANHRLQNEQKYAPGAGWERIRKWEANRQNKEAIEITSRRSLTDQGFPRQPKRSF